MLLDSFQDKTINEIYESQAESFAKLTELYLAYNQETNISAIRDESEIVAKHYLDSLQVLNPMLELLQKSEQPSLKIMDLGSGGGFPVLPLAIVLQDFPQIEFLAVDSVAKKTKFIEQVQKKLQLKNIQVITARAEDLAQLAEHRGTYDLLLARALANLPVLLEYSIPFLKVDSYLLAFKNQAIDEEMASAQNAFVELNASLEKKLEYADKQFLFIKKNAVTDSKYPRKAGKPSKSPL